MSKIRFAIVGSGWRALFYVRIARALPEYFEVTAMLLRSIDKAERFHTQYQIPTTISKERLLRTRPDFVVVAVDKPSVAKVSIEYLQAGVPVLAETPAGDSLRDLLRLWDARQRLNGKIQVAEQYYRYPTLAAKIAAVRMGLLGDPYFVNISTVHDYHAASLIRQFLNTGNEAVTVFGKRYYVPIVQTDSRNGLTTEGVLKEYNERVRLTLEFESGKTAFYDFGGVQYHSYIRTRHLNVQGPKGELDDDTIRYVNEENVPVCQQICPLPSSTTPDILAVTMGGQLLYRSEYPLTGLTEDEIAIADLLRYMKTYVDTGTEPVPGFTDTMQDAYIYTLMNQAASHPDQKIVSEKQPWNP